MNKYELNINGRELCKRHRKLRCGECEYIDELEKRVQELEKERSDWKGKHSILKRRYKGLQQKMNARWRYNRAVENEGRANKNVLEKFRKQNQLYKQALEDALYSLKIFEDVDAYETIEEALQKENPNENI